MNEMLLASGGPLLTNTDIVGNYRRRTSGPINRDAMLWQVIDNKIYCWGGTSAGAADTQMWTYLPEKDQWIQLSTVQNGAIPAARYSAAICTIGTKIYMFGGMVNDVTNTAYVFDTATLTWTQLANMPGASYHFDCAAVNGKIYIYGGLSVRDNNPNTNLYEYDPASNTYRTISNNRVLRHGHSCFGDNGLLYIVSGVNYGTLLNSLLTYNPSNNTWAEKAACPFSLTFVSCSKTSKYLYVFGGSANNTNGSSNLYRYNIAADSWSNMPGNSSFPRMWARSAIYKNRIYMHGGRNGNTLFPETIEIS